VNTSYWAKVCPGALETVTEKAIAMTREIF